MNRFAELIGRLTHERRPEARIAWLREYFQNTGDPERGHALAALTGALRFPRIGADEVEALIAERCDPKLWALSRDYVGDPHEALALFWPVRPGANRAPTLSDLAACDGFDRRRLSAWLDALDAEGRWLLLKACAGGLRLSAHAPLAKRAIAALGGRTLAEIEALWPASAPPYPELFACLEGRSLWSETAEVAPMRPMMQCAPFAPEIMDETCLAEWKWDGRRVQLVRESGMNRLYATSGEDMAARFPGIGEGLDVDVALDCVLMPYSATRLDAHLVAFDLPDDADLPIEERRGRLEDLIARSRPARIRLSPLISCRDPEQAPAGADGIVLKRAASHYRAGRDHGAWREWPRRPREVDLVLLYANPGPELVFGAWRQGELLAVGKAAANEPVLAEANAFIAGHVIERRGPALILEPSMVATVAYDHVDPSRRHRSGLCLRDGRIVRLSPEKAPRDAADLDALGSKL